jgi:ABC-type multidrug transport system ATPase subunit
MQRRVEVAHVLLRRPRLVLLDEALSGLDSSAQELISAVAARTIEDHGGVIMVSHDRAALDRSCDRVLALKTGRLE